MVEAQNALDRYRGGSAAAQDASVPAPPIDQTKPKKSGTQNEPSGSVAFPIAEKAAVVAGSTPQTDLPKPEDRSPPNEATIDASRPASEKGGASQALGSHSDQLEAGITGARKQPSESVVPQASATTIARNAPEP
jgi:hypothetical protein